MHMPTLYFFAKDCYGHAYYQSSIGHLHPALKGRDFLQEILAAAQLRNLPVIAYYSVIWDNHAAEQHPEWRMLGPDGKALSDTVTSELGKWRYLCHNSGYAEYAKSMLGEISRRYPVQGFHLDMFNCDFGGLSCYCESCQTAFRQRSGKDLPKQATWDRTWRDFLQFRYESVEKLMLELRSACRSEDADLPVVMNYHGAPNFDWRVGQLPVRHSMPSSLATGETYTPMFGDLYPAMEGRYVRAVAHGRPFEMVSWRMNRITDFTLKDLPQLRWEVLTALVHGGSTMLIDQPFHDGSLDAAAYDRIREVFDEANRMEDTLAGDFVPEVGLYYSSKTRDWYARDDQRKFLLPMLGAYKALVESHYQVDFILDELIANTDLHRFAAIVLPDVAILADEEIEKLREFVDRGGLLLATFNTSLCDEDGNLQNDFGLADVFGVSYQRHVDCDNCYYQAHDSNDSAGATPVLCEGQAIVVSNNSAAPEGTLREAFHKRHVPERFFSHNIHPPYREIGPAVFRNNFGAGQAIYVPFGLDRSYADRYELSEHRTILRKLIDSHAGPRLVEVKAPLNCEVVLRRAGSTLWIHLTMFNPLRQSVALPSLNQPVRPSIRMEEPAIYEVELVVKDEFDSAEALRPDTSVCIDGPRISLLSRDVHEVIKVQLSA